MAIRPDALAPTHPADRGRQRREPALRRPHRGATPSSKPTTNAMIEYPGHAADRSVRARGCMVADAASGNPRLRCWATRRRGPDVPAMRLVRLGEVADGSRRVDS